MLESAFKFLSDLGAKAAGKREVGNRVLDVGGPEHVRWFIDKAGDFVKFDADRRRGRFATGPMPIHSPVKSWSTCEFIAIRLPAKVCTGLPLMCWPT